MYRVCRLLLEKMGMNDDRAQYWSKATSAVLRLGLTVGTLFAGTVSVPSVLGTAGSVMSTTKLAKLGAGAAGDKILGFNLDNTKKAKEKADNELKQHNCLLYTSPSPRDRNVSRMPSSA